MIVTIRLIHFCPMWAHDSTVGKMCSTGAEVAGSREVCGIIGALNGIACRW